MIPFREPRLDDKPMADQILQALNYRESENCFGDLFIWRKNFKTEIAFVEDYLLAKFEAQGRTMYMFPAGKGKTEQMLRLMVEDAKERGLPFVMTAVTPAMKEELEAAFPGSFTFEPARESFDYIYNASDLIDLAGRKYHSKRNHFVRFQHLGDWSYEEINDDNFADCVEMNDRWCEENGCAKDREMRAEFCAVTEAFRNYKPLGLKGGLLRLGGQVVAFSIGQKLCSDTFIVHIEKALREAEGAYAAINREFCAHNCAGFAYVNREDDAGVEGLRKAKLSYHPAILLEKNIAVLREGAVL